MLWEGQVPTNAAIAAGEYPGQGASDISEWVQLSDERDAPGVAGIGHQMAPRRSDHRRGEGLPGIGAITADGEVERGEARCT